MHPNQLLKPPDPTFSPGPFPHPRGGEAGRRPQNLPLKEQESHTYLEKVEEAVSDRKRWRVRRYVVFGTFAYGKLVMWHDLDPERWPTGKGPGTGPVTVDLLAGSGTGGQAAAEHPVDDPDFEARLPLLVADADASQLSAIIDGVEGNSLAIKGPPGTGKSQTITNLIAAALAKGKHVLFVAEKMAALDVVKSRLDHFGLGDFVLELHSTKARKKDVLEGVARRLDLRRERSPGQLAETQSELKRLKRELTAYVDLINEPVGKNGRTLHEVLWAEARTREAQLPSAINRVTLGNAAELGNQDLEWCRDILASLEKAWVELTAGGGSLSTHPWKGMSRILPQFEHDSLIAVMEGWNETLGQLLDTVDGQGAWCGLRENATQADLELLVALLLL